MMRWPARWGLPAAVPKTAILGRRSVMAAGRTAATVIGLILPRAYSVALRTICVQMGALSNRNAPPAITSVPSGWLATAGPTLRSPGFAPLVTTAEAGITDDLPPVGSAPPAQAAKYPS